MLGLTIINQESYKLSDIYQVCLWQGPTMPTVEQLPMYPTDTSVNPGDLGLIVMGDYRSDVRWEYFNEGSGYPDVNHSANTVTWRWMNPDIESPVESENEALLYWQSMSTGRSTAIFEFRYKTDVYPELNTFNTIIIYGMRSGVPCILSYGYMNNTLEFSQVRSIVLEVNVESSTTTNVRSVYLYAEYLDHVLDSINNLALIHNNLSTVITKSSVVSSKLTEYNNKWSNFKLSLTPSNSSNELYINSQDSLLSTIDTNYRYVIGKLPDLLNIRETLINKDYSYFISSDELTYLFRTQLVFDRTLGLLIASYSNNYIILHPTGYNKVGYVYLFKNFELDLCRELEVTIKYYEGSLFIQVANHSFMISLPRLMDSIPITDDIKYNIYNVSESDVFSDNDAVILPEFDLCNVVYYDYDVYSCPTIPTPEITAPFIDNIDYRFRLDSTESLKLIKSEYDIQYRRYRSISDNESFALYDAVSIISTENKLLVEPYKSSFSYTNNFQINKLEGDCKYFVSNKSIYCIMKTEDKLKIYLLNLGLDTEFRLVNELTDKSFVSGRGINLIV